MKSYKLALMTILTSTISIASSAFAGDDSNMNMQENKTSLVYVGGMAGYSTVSGTMENQLGLSVEPSGATPAGLV